MANAVEKIPAKQNIDDTNVPAVMPTLLERAVSSGASVEVMERLLDMQARVDSMQAKKAFDDAMAKLRADMPEVKKSVTVSFGSGANATNYKHEDLADLTKALSPKMAELGLSFRWRTQSDQTGVTVTCIISHRDGHSEENPLSCGFDKSGAKNAIQALGSAVTYLQRYTLKAAVGMAASRDDDGQGAGVGNDDRQPQRSTDQRSETGRREVQNKAKAEARGDYTVHEKAIREAKTVDELRDYWQTIKWSEVPIDWKPHLIAEKDARVAELSKPAATEDDGFPFDDDFPGDRQ